MNKSLNIHLFALFSIIVYNLSCIDSLSIFKYSFESPHNNVLHPVNITTGINKVTITDIPAYSKHIVFQVHSPLKPIQVSYSVSPVYSSSKNGSHVGLLSVLPDLVVVTEAHFYVISNYSYAFNVWVKLDVYTIDDPIPGGCNLESNLENDPNVIPVDSHLSTQWLIDIPFSLSGVWVSRSQMAECQRPAVWGSLVYKLYALPLASAGGSLEIKNEDLFPTAFDTLSNDGRITRDDVMIRLHFMTNLTWVEKEASLLGTYSSLSKMASRFSMARRSGSAQIIALVVEYSIQSNVRKATYVPTVLYGCPIPGRTECTLVLPKIWAKVVFGLMAIVGLAFACIAHRWPKTQGLLCVGIVILLYGLAVAQFLGDGELTVIGGTVVCLVIFPVLILISLFLGRLMADESKLFRYPSAILVAFIFIAILYFSPLGEQGSMKKLYTSIIVFPISNLVILIVLLPFKNFCLAVCTVTIGLYVFFSGISIGLLPGSLFHYLVLDQYLRIAIPDYIEQIHYSPLGLADVILFCIWSLLTLLMALVIFLRLRKGQSRVAPVSVSVGQTNWVDNAPEERGTENQRLFDRRGRTSALSAIYGSTRPSYGTTSSPQAPSPILFSPTGVQGAFPRPYRGPSVVTAATAPSLQKESVKSFT